MLTLDALVKEHAHPRAPTRTDPVDLRARYEHKVRMCEAFLKSCGGRLSALMKKVEADGAEVWFSGAHYRTKSRVDLDDLLREAAAAPHARKAVQDLAKASSLGRKPAPPTKVLSPRVAEGPSETVPLRTT